LADDADFYCNTYTVKINLTGFENLLGVNLEIIAKNITVILAEDL